MTFIGQFVMSILVSYCYVTNYHELCDSDEHPFISQFLWVRSQGTAKLDLTRLQSRNQLRLQSFLRHGGPLPNSCGCWQNSLPCCYISEVLRSYSCHGALPHDSLNTVPIIATASSRSAGQLLHLSPVSQDRLSGNTTYSLEWHSIFYWVEACLAHGEGTVQGHG